MTTPASGSVFGRSSESAWSEAVPAIPRKARRSTCKGSAYAFGANGQAKAAPANHKQSLHSSFSLFLSRADAKIELPALHIDADHGYSNLIAEAIASLAP